MKKETLLQQVIRRMSKLRVIRTEQPTTTLQERIVNRIHTGNKIYNINVETGTAPPPQAPPQAPVLTPLAQAQAQALRTAYGGIIVTNTQQRNIKRSAKQLIGVPENTTMSILQLYNRFRQDGGDDRGLGALGRGDSGIAYGFFMENYPI